MPWAASSSKRPRLGLVSWVWTNPKHLAGPSAGTLLPAMTSNQPSWRERCRAECTVAAVQADRQRQVRAGQLLPVGRAALDEERAFGAQVVVEALADPVGVAAHRGPGARRPSRTRPAGPHAGRRWWWWPARAAAARSAGLTPRSTTRSWWTDGTGDDASSG